MAEAKAPKPYGAKMKPLDLSEHLNFPQERLEDQWWESITQAVQRGPTGLQRPWGITFRMGGGIAARAICLMKETGDVAIEIGAKADFLCFLHGWVQKPEDIRPGDPTEGLVVAEYELVYDDGQRHVQPIRGRFEVGMAESPGPPWLAVPWNMQRTIDPARKTAERPWGKLQLGLHGAFVAETWLPMLIYAMPNPRPDVKIESLVLRGLQASPLLISAVTLYRGSGHPLRHLPRRTYRVKSGRKPARVEKAEVDLGQVARIERTTGPRGKAWLDDPSNGRPCLQMSPEDGEDLIEAVGAQDATLSVKLADQDKTLRFSLGRAFHEGRSASGEAKLEVLGRQRQWMQVRIVDASTGRPTPARVHFSGSRGRYLAPYGHHSQVNPNWFEDYGADVVIGGKQHAYVSGEFTTDLPVGDVYVEIWKGFEYQPLRSKVTIRPGDKELELTVYRWKDLRSSGWVTADTHVHFISPHTAWLEAQCEGVNVVNLLASQWGRLFTNVGDYTGRIGLNEDDTIVYVGTENRNHMLGHMSMLGTQGSPVYPMCTGGPGESWVGDPDFLTMAEWALENRQKGGLVIRPHFPFSGHTEDPVGILKGLVDALEIDGRNEFQVEEWYRYLNCGYRVAAVGGTDKMSAQRALGWKRTYAKLDPNEPFNYDQWADAVRAGRTVTTNGPLMDLAVEGRAIGDVIQLPAGGGALEVQALAECIWPLGTLEIVHNGTVVLREQPSGGSRLLCIKDKVNLRGSGWIAARCSGVPGDPGARLMAHTSPIYVKCGDTRAFDGPAAEHMLALVEGGIEYLNTLATVFDESSRERMVRLFSEAREELRGRLVVEGGHTHHHGDGQYHTHGHSAR